MKLVCISDTHGEHELLDLPAGDVLIHAGDLTAHGKKQETHDFMRWFGEQSFEHKLCVAGNHDTFMESDPDVSSQFAADHGVVLLNDSGYQIENVNFWGSPITPRFYNWSFMRDPGEPIEAHWRLNSRIHPCADNSWPTVRYSRQRSTVRKVCVNAPVVLHCLRASGMLRPVNIFSDIFTRLVDNESKNNVSYYNVCSMDEHYRIAHEAVIVDVASQ